MNIHDAFIHDIVDNPNDDTPRLIYADHLDDLGRHDRAEFIRLQCALARWPCECDEVERVYYDECRCKEKGELQRRQLQLLVANGFHQYPGSKWVNAECPILWKLSDRGANFTFRRGFVEEISLSLPDFIKHHASLTSMLPITEVTIIDKLAWKSIGDLHVWFQGEDAELTEILPEDLPWFLYDLLPGNPDAPWKWFLSKNLSRKALSNACLDWSRLERTKHVQRPARAALDH